MNLTRQRTLGILGALLVSAIIAACVVAMPAVRTLTTTEQAYSTRLAQQQNYRLFTTPLPQAVIVDLCSKLGIQRSNLKCRAGVSVYAPELFDAITAYFTKLPGDQRAYANVQQILGRYQEYCEQPNSKGFYSCSYDLRGDGVYPVAFYFNGEGFIYRIIANTGGS